MKNKRYIKWMTASLLSTAICSSAWAQEVEFDLSSQRSEIQDVLPVPGHKVNHKGWIVNPTPQQMIFKGTGALDVTCGFQLKDKQRRFSTDIPFLTIKKKGIRLTVDYGTKISKKNHVKSVSGAYTLTVNAKGVSIIGYDERGAYYGLQTLRELMESPEMKNGQLPYLEINDYPVMPNRGVVEGFYGEPWSHEVRKSLIDFYGKFKMNAYLYGPKDDPYHSCPNWRLPYPEKEAQNIKELIEACQRNRVDFVWAIHPGQDIKWNEEDYNNLVHKFNIMYDLGVRHFAVFFDDISGEGTNPRKQTELLNRLTKEFVQAKGDVSPLTVCPTDYSKLWANPKDNGPLAIYGKTLEPEVKVFWTGDVVCSDLTPETLEFINSRIKRPAYYWWNYPVTDYVRHILLQGPVYGLNTSLTEKETCGIISNPMEHGEASKLALYSVADYSWNPKAYNAIDSWERGLVELVPEASEAYRTFAIHSADTETGYRRDESWETETFRLNQWNDQLAQSLENEFKKIEATPAILEKEGKNPALLKELAPWLVEFGKLGTRGRKVIELGRIFRDSKNDAMFWNKYVENTMNSKDREAYNAHKSGTMKLQPFYENMMDDMAHEYLKRLSNQVPTDYKGIGSFGNSGTILTKLMLDNDSVSHYTSGMPQRPGDWIGVDLRATRDVSEISILQGRNSKDDVDYFDHAILECSVDGKTWHSLIDDMHKQYIIHWKGTPLKARYVRIRRLDSEKKNYAAVRSFEVNPVRIETLGFEIQTEDKDKAVLAFDNNLATSYVNQNVLQFSVKPQTVSYTILCNKLEKPFKCIQLDAKGNVLTQEDVSSAYSQIKVINEKVATIYLKGIAEIFEIVPTTKQ